MNAVEKWLSVEEIAEHLGISKETVYRWLEKGRIPSHRIGKLWKFKVSEVDAWVVNGGASDAGGKQLRRRGPRDEDTQAGV